jgi:ABC-2 type transport system permease protein
MSAIRFFFYKYLFYLIPFTVLIVVLISVSNHFLQIDGPMWWVSLFCAVLICWTVVALALGFGAIFADYHAENRSAAMGPGSVFYFFCAISYMLVVLLSGLSPAYKLVKSWFRQGGMPLSDAILTALWIIGMIILSGVVMTLICRRGIAALKPK